MPASDGIEIASMYVGQFGIAPKAEDESAAAFRSRVADVLRANRMIVDAHEAYSNKYHDEATQDGELSAMTGTLGACALALGGHERPSVGDDIVAGLYTENTPPPDPQRDQQRDALLLMMAVLSGR